MIVLEKTQEVKRHEPMKKTIYVELLNEGTTTYRPVLSEHVCDNTYILGDKDDDTEEWAFKPGGLVLTEPHTFSDGTVHPLVIKQV